MKSKLLCLVFFVMAFLAMAGCGKSKEAQEETYSIYYLDRNENHISALDYAPINETKEQLVKELLEQLIMLFYLLMLQKGQCLKLDLY